MSLHVICEQCVDTVVEVYTLCIQTEHDVTLAVYIPAGHLALFMVGFMIIIHTIIVIIRQ